MKEFGMPTKTQANKAKNDVVVTTPETDATKAKEWGKNPHPAEEEGVRDPEHNKGEAGPTDGEVVSNHNSLSPAEPLGLAQVKAMKDYNPQRRESSRSNIQSDVTTLNGEHDAILVDHKGDRPSPHADDSKGGDDMDSTALAAVEGADADVIDENNKDDGNK